MSHTNNPSITATFQSRQRSSHATFTLDNRRGGRVIMLLRPSLSLLHLFNSPHLPLSTNPHLNRNPCIRSHQQLPPLHHILFPLTISLGRHPVPNKINLLHGVTL
ncbi:hypothetical protein BDM02DRAFT_909082 [Thelephora ganbajun]|uniref:Uncharacterized protein n=1 Tax=Thelephora ganbajun TaxID=370292 RepID=A0ACB6ZNA7_THEGA|nr:hypothetical protein BDM02DRAFT_909082 [Thelephora ganbajun]